MPQKARRLHTNWSKGELSPRIEGRPDLAAYFEGGKTIENFVLLRQGGLDRRVGTRFVQEVKHSSRDTVLIPFEASVDAAYAIEVGDEYIRFHKNKAPILNLGVPVEIASPYTAAQVRALHFTQSVDVLFLFHGSHQQRKLSRLSDTSWVLSPIVYSPPPTYQADTDISGGTATLVPGAISGTNVPFVCSEAKFLEGDVGRIIVFGASRAMITGFGVSAGDTTTPNTTVRADILDAFPSTGAIPAGEWLMRLSPQVPLNPTKKEPVGRVITLRTLQSNPPLGPINAFRSADVGKYLFLYGGLVKITQFVDATELKGEIVSVLQQTSDEDPPAAPAGAWTLEVEAWTAALGYPRTGEFFQGRLGQAGTANQPTTWWLSTSDSFDSYAAGVRADQAVEYTIASRQLNAIEWLADNKDLFIGTGGAEFRARGGRTDEPIGGDVVPLVERETSHGCAAIQPVPLSRRLLYIDRSYRRILSMAYSLEEDGFDSVEVTGAAEHITEGGIRRGAIGVARRPDPRLYFVREDGTLITLTYFHHEKVVGFTRLVTDGEFESVCVIPQPGGKPDQVWVVVKRTIDGSTKRYVEVFDEDAAELEGRAWTSLQTDCAALYDGVSTTTITGLSHLEGETVDVVANGSYRGTKDVSGGQITLDEAATVVEVGLHYASTMVTMRPAVDGAVIEGLPRAWSKVWVRLLGTIGGQINGEWIQYPASDLDELGLFTGDRDVYPPADWSTEGRITVTQPQPYPMTLLALFGELSVGPHG